MIFPEASGAPETVATKQAALGASLAFDYRARRFRLVDGSPPKIGGTDAAAQWLELFVRTVPKRYAVYGEAGFGVDATKLIGKKAVPNGAILSEIQREIEEGVPLCPAIRTVYGFDVAGGTIAFRVVLMDGTEREVSIEL